MPPLLKMLATVFLAGSSTAFNVQIPTPVKRYGDPFGGPTNIPTYSDYDQVKAGMKIISVWARMSNHVEAVGLYFDYFGTDVFSHGGRGGELHTLKLGDGEYVNKVEWDIDDAGITYIGLFTNKKKDTPFSVGTRPAFPSSETPLFSQHQLAGFVSYEDGRIRNLQLIWACIHKTCR